MMLSVARSLSCSICSRFLATLHLPSRLSKSCMVLGRRNLSSRAPMMVRQSRARWSPPTRLRTISHNTVTSTTTTTITITDRAMFTRNLTSRVSSSLARVHHLNVSLTVWPSFRPVSSRQRRSPHVLTPLADAVEIINRVIGSSGLGTEKRHVSHSVIPYVYPIKLTSCPEAQSQDCRACSRRVDFSSAPLASMAFD
jgi:hypothetical protein